MGCLSDLHPDPPWLGCRDVRAQSRSHGLPCNGIPYNIDADCNGMINAQDLLAFLPYYEFEFVANIDSLSLDLEYANDTLFLLNLSGALIDAVELGFADGAQGPQGDPGMDGAQGPQGVPAWTALKAARRSRHGRRQGPKVSPAWTALDGPRAPGMDGAQGPMTAKTALQARRHGRR